MEELIATKQEVDCRCTLPLVAFILPFRGFLPWRKQKVSSKKLTSRIALWNWCLKLGFGSRDLLFQKFMLRMDGAVQNVTQFWQKEVNINLKVSLNSDGLRGFQLRIPYCLAQSICGAGCQGKDSLEMKLELFISFAPSPLTDPRQKRLGIPLQGIERSFLGIEF